MYHTTKRKRYFLHKFDGSFQDIQDCTNYLELMILDPDQKGKNSSIPKIKLETKSFKHLM